MKPTPLILCCAIMVMAGGFSRVVARPANAAHIGYVYPAGARQGDVVSVKIGGENVYGATTALVSGVGVVAEVLDSRDPNGGQREVKKKNKKKKAAVIDEIITLKVTLAPDAEHGNRDICLVMTNMISNKLIFQVGQLMEAAEVEPNNQRKTAMAITSLPVVVNGQIMPGDVDWFQFKAGKGQCLVVDVVARSLSPYIADGVPGWFQAMVTLRDARNREMVVADSFRFSQDPVLICTIPEDGEYALSIRDTIYRGREDFGYRLRIGELPYITGVFPLGGPVETNPVPVRLLGVNLPCDAMAVDMGEGAIPFRYLAVTNKGLLSNRVRFAGSDLPERVETGPAPDAKHARAVVVPVVVNGCIRLTGEKHFYRFQGKKGQTVSLEVQARRMGSSLDSLLVLLNGEGRKIAANDDLKDPREGFMTHHADSGMTCVLPGSGDYTVMIQDVQGRGGDDYAYRLRIGIPVPDFDLRVTPAAVRIPQGGSAPLTMHVIRRDGFAGEIQLSLDAALKGITLDGARIPPGVDSIPVTLSASPPISGTFTPRVSGMAVVDGRTMVREVVPAENLMQAFLYRHLLPFQEETVVVTVPPVPFYVVPRLPAEGVLNLARGKETGVAVRAIRSEGYPGGIRLQLVDPPKGMSFRKAWITANTASAMVNLRVDSGVATNLQGNLIITATMQVERDATPEEKARMAVKAAQEREAKAAAVGTNALVEGTVSTNLPPVVDVSDDKPVRVTRPVEVTLAAVPFRIVE